MPPSSSFAAERQVSAGNHLSIFSPGAPTAKTVIYRQLLCYSQFQSSACHLDH
jgi:hypothetical protein